MSQSTLINSCLAVAAILAAVPWGVAAVAASYSATGLLIRTPVLIYFASKVSNVSQRDMYSVVIPQLIFGGVIFGATYLSLELLRTPDHLYRILVAVGIGLGIFLAGLALSARQRKSLHQIVELFNARRKRPPQSAENKS
jgi:PST family polysaccharide transporter